MHNKDAEKITANNNFYVVVIFASFFIIPFLYSSKLMDPVLGSGLLGLSVLSFVSLLFILFLNIRNKNYFDSGLFKNGTVLSFLIFIIISGLSVFNALNKQEAFSEFFKLLLYFIFFIALLFIFFKTTFADYFSKSVILFSIIILFLGAVQFYQVIEKGYINHQSTYLIKATFAHRNLYCEMLLLCFPFTLFGIISYKKSWRFLSVVSSVFILIYITILLSRTAWLALVAGSLCTFIMFLLFNKKFVKKGVIKRILFYLIIVFTITFSSVYIYSRLDNLTTLKKQMEGFTNLKYGSSRERLVLWQKSIEITKNNYLLGVGLGNWKIIMPSAGIENMRSETGELIFQRPHNDIVWVFSECGFAGLIPYLLLFVFSIFYVFKILKNSGNKSESFFALMLFYCLIIYSVISCFSFPKERITQSMFIIYILAMIVVIFKSKNDKSISFKWLTPVLTATILLNGFIVYVAYSRIKSEFHLKNAINYKIKEDFQNTILEINKVDTLFYTLDPTATPVNWYSGVACYRLHKFDEAKHEFLKAYHYNPYHLRTLNNLATCYIKNNESELAVQYYKKALEISPDFEDALKNLSIIYYKQSKYAESYDYLSKCKIQFNDPKYSLLVNSLLPFIIDKLITKVDDEIIISILKEIKKSDKWMKDIHIKHISEKRTIENQLLLDAIYDLEIIQKLITTEKAKELKEKYHINEKSSL